MIRILHTADWHIGQMLRGHSREHEHRLAFAAMGRLIVEREVDVLVVAGDVFDTQNPSGEAMRLLYEALAGFARTRPGLRIVLTAGNHDAAGRLEAAAPLFAAFGIEAIGNIRRAGGKLDVARHLLRLKDRAGREAAALLAVSYPTAACLPPFASLAGDDGSPVAKAVAALYAELGEAMRPFAAGLPVMVTGHLHVAGGLESEGAERRILVGGQHAAPPAIFPADAVYVALGHLHRPQWVEAGRVRYAGSLFPLSATEQPYRHGVTLVEIDGSHVTAQHVELPRPVPFLRLPETGEITLDTLGDRLKALDLDPATEMHLRPFLQVRLKREGLTAGFREEADRVAEAYPVRMVELSLAERAAPETKAAMAATPLDRLAERDPADMFRQAFIKAHGREPVAAHHDVFHAALAGEG
jgi:exonuclease SbcD